MNLERELAFSRVTAKHTDYMLDLCAAYENLLLCVSRSNPIHAQLLCKRKELEKLMFTLFQMSERQHFALIMASLAVARVDSAFNCFSEALKAVKASRMTVVRRIYARLKGVSLESIEEPVAQRDSFYFAFNCAKDLLLEDVPETNL